MFEHRRTIVAREAIAAFHKKGVKLILFSKFTWADQAEDWYRKELKQWAAKDPHGDVRWYEGYRYQTPTQLSDINTRRFAVMCPMAARWREIATGEFKKVVALGAAGAPLDTDSCRPPAGGSDRLCAVWLDPDFDARQPALYYARVLELPTCRWSTWACNAAGVDCTRPDTIGPGHEPCCDPDYPHATRERAWASPIWYQP